jgi:NAD(P)-dependent dehydrogenase (short-subunit alcohol dehydrogenase family)
MSMNKQRSNRRAVVIGASSGMGAAIAIQLHEEGYELVLADLALERLTKLASWLGAEARAVDVASNAAVRELAMRCNSGIDALVITAGLSASMAPFERILDVNLGGTASILREFSAVMTKRGAAVCLSSIAGHVPGPIDAPTDAALRDADSPALGQRVMSTLAPEMRVTGMAYALSKYGVLRLVERVGVDWGKRELRVCSVSPGIIDTPMGRLECDANRATADAALAAAPISRRGTAEEVANVVAFLCSSQARFMTACDVLVDGGWVGAMRATPGGDAFAGALIAAREKSAAR